MMNILLNITAVIPTEMRMQQHILDFKGVSPPPPHPCCFPFQCLYTSCAYSDGCWQKLLILKRCIKGPWLIDDNNLRYLSRIVVWNEKIFTIPIGTANYLIFFSNVETFCFLNNKTKTFLKTSFIPYKTVRV